MHIPFDIDLSRSIILHTKNLSCQYEEGRLRYIKAGDTELVRMIYGAVRDADWETVACNIMGERIHQEEDGFTITYTAHYRQDNIIYEAAHRIEGRPDDTITFDMQGKALSDFKSNRIGLCAHLPVKECAGVSVNVINESGEKVLTRFPENISPHQPFSRVQQLHWTTENNAKIRLSLEGDVFEAEDQRNWMDHSFKIYSRPLSLPFPFNIWSGDTMRQKMAVQLSFLKNDVISNEKASTNIESRNVPAIGFAAADEPALLTTGEIALLQSVPFAHYRAELDFEKDWRAIFSIHSTNAKALGTALELVLLFSDNYMEEIKGFITAISNVEYNIKSILPLHKAHKVTPLFLQEYFYPLLKKSFPLIMVGYGTDIYFTELNRQRPQHDGFDFISFSLNPQVHSFDEKSMLENIETIPDIIRTIRSFTGKPVFVSPITFKKRKNHDCMGDSRHSLVNNFDERQHTWFGAGWFLLCLFQLCDAQQVTFFKTTGGSGIIGAAGEASPLYRVLTQLKLFWTATMTKRITASATQIIFHNRAGEKLVFQIRSMQ